MECAFEVPELGPWIGPEGDRDATQLTAEGELLSAHRAAGDESLEAAWSAIASAWQATAWACEHVRAGGRLDDAGIVTAHARKALSHYVDTISRPDDMALRLAQLEPVMYELETLLSRRHRWRSAP
jgi:hypothetical protein